MNFTCRLIPYVLIVLVSLTSCESYSDPRRYNSFPRLDNRNRYQDQDIRQRNRCNKNFEIENGDRRFRERGSLVKFNCNNGYTLVGATIAVCLRDEWSEPIPYCVKAGCRRIVVPVSAFVRQSFGGGVIYFYCDEGFRLVGSDILICDGRSWNGTEPTCQGVNPPTTSTIANGETTPNLESWDENTTTSAPINTTTMNENRTNANASIDEESSTASASDNRMVTSNDNSTNQLHSATPQPNQSNSRNTMLTNSTVQSITEINQNIIYHSTPTEAAIPTYQVITTFPNTANRTAAIIHNSTSIENVTTKSHINPTGPSNVNVATVIPNPAPISALLNTTISVTALTTFSTPTATKETLKPTTMTTTTTSKPTTTTTTTTLRSTATTTLKPKTTTTTLKPITTTTLRPTTTTTLKPTTTTLRPTTTTTLRPTTTTTLRPTTTTTLRPTTTTTLRPTTTTTLRPTTTTTLRPTTTTTLRPTTTTTLKPKITTTLRPTTTTRTTTTRIPWTTSIPTTTQRFAKPTPSTTKVFTKIVVRTTESPYYSSYDYGDNQNIQDNYVPLVPHRHRPIDHKGKSGNKSPKEIAPNTKASQLNVTNGDRISFGHIMYVFGMIVIALVSFSALGVILLYCWRKNKGIARARSYDLDGRTLSAHDANEDFMWLENRDNRI